MKNKALLAIFAVALFVRIVSLGSLPYGFHADEARAAWNAWTLLTAGTDDYGKAFPLYYDSFGDQRPTGIFYATIPALVMFGKSIFAARLPAALAGAFSSVALYWLTKLITKQRGFSLLAALFLSLSPWHIVVSRSGSEVVFSGMLILFGLSFWLDGLAKKDTKKLVVSITLALSSYFFYHTARVLVPLFWFTTWWFAAKREKMHFLFIVVLILGTALLASQTEARGRFNQVSIFGADEIEQNFLQASAQEGPGKVVITRIFHNKFVWYSKSIAENYLNYFSGNFLIGNSAQPVRYTVPFTGLLTYADLFLFLAGVASLFYFRRHYIVIMLLALSPLAASLTTYEAPNLHRAMYMVFFVSILQTLGARFLLKAPYKTILLAVVGVSYFGLWGMFWHNYSVHTEKSTIVFHRNGGALEMAKAVVQFQGQYSKIYISGTPSDPTPWVGFVGNWNTGEFIEQAKNRKEHNWTYQNLFFSGQRCTTEIYLEPEDNALLIDAENCKDPTNTDKINYSLEFTIYRPDGSWAYKGWRSHYK